MTFANLWYRLVLPQYRSIHGFWTSLYHTQYKCTDNFQGIIQLSICKVLFIPKIAVPLRFLDSLTNFLHLYCVCQILVFNAIHTIITDVEGNIRIDRLPLGRGTDCETDISLDSGDIISTRLYHDPWKTLYPDISLHISGIYINIDNIRSYWIYWHNFEKKHLCQK